MYLQLNQVNFGALAKHNDRCLDDQIVQCEDTHRIKMLKLVLEVNEMVGHPFLPPTLG